MSKREPFDEDLDAAFAELRAQAPRPDAALMGRVMADAAQQAPARGRGRLWRGWLLRLPAMGQGDWGFGVPAGLAVSLVVGIWIGAAAPGPLEALDAVFWGDPMLQALADPALELAQ